VDQEIRFCTRPDAVRIAYAIIGDGPPLVYARPLFGHLELEWERAEIRNYFGALARHHTVIRWDTHGTGLSDRDRTQFTLDGQVADIEAVVDLLELDRFDLVGDASGAPATIAYAADHPDRVHRLVLYAPFAYGPAIGQPEVLEAMTALMRANWNLGAKTFADVIIPDADTATAADAARLLRGSVEPEPAARLYELAWTVDVRDRLPLIGARTLVLHRQGERTVPFALGRELASHIPYARFVPLEGRSNLPYIGDVGSVLRAIAEFLGDPPPVEPGVMPMTILFSEIDGAAELIRRMGHARAQTAVRAHEEIVRSAFLAYDAGGAELFGNGLMAVFVSPSSATDCAIRIQRELGRWRETHAEPTLHARIGISVEREVPEGEDTEPAPRALATRICAEAAPGEILVGDVVRLIVGATRHHFEDRGLAALAGFPEPIRLHCLGWDHR
jgi:pimeloyl-ACP methyl ester carboxylesterase/class 3 adenylate cyclase